MSIEERLFALVQHCRQQGGDALLSNAGQLTQHLSSQAPDLHAEIRALAAALATGAAARINAAADADAEAQKIATELAVAQRLSMASVTPALAVARRIGPLSANAPAAPIPGGWAGDSVAVGAAPAAPVAPPAPPPSTWANAPAPQYAPPAAPYPQAPAAPPSSQAKPWFKQPAAIIGAIAIGSFFLFQSMSGQQNGGGGQNSGAITANDFPTLAVQEAQRPTINVRRSETPGMIYFLFTLQTPQGQIPTTLAFPENWQGDGSILMTRPGDFDGAQAGPQTMGAAAYTGQQVEGRALRIAQFQMIQDNLGLGNLCVAFRSQAGQQDVQVQGAEFCVADAACQQPIGCGKLQ